LHVWSGGEGGDAGGAGGAGGGGDGGGGDGDIGTQKQKLTSLGTFRHVASTRMLRRFAASVSVRKNAIWRPAVRS